MLDKKKPTLDKSLLKIDDRNDHYTNLLKSSDKIY